VRDVAPHSDAVATLEFLRRELQKALKTAQEIRTFVSVNQAARIIGRPESTLTRMCRQRGAEIGARKVSGVWQIHWPTFEASISQQDF
jgi:hypothetical protein